MRSPLVLTTCLQTSFGVIRWPDAEHRRVPREQGRLLARTCTGVRLGSDLEQTPAVGSHYTKRRVRALVAEAR